MKKWYESKTLWANGIAVVAAALAAFGMDIGPELQATTVAFIMGIVNVVLRLKTDTAVG